MDSITYNDAGKPAIDTWAAQINQAATAAGVPPCALAAIVERESGGDANARSGDGGWGLCQITAGVDANGIYTATGAHMLDPLSNLAVAARDFLAPAITECIALRRSNASVMNGFSSEVLYFAFCAYNAGFGTVSSAVAAGNDPDAYTTGRYGKATLALYLANLNASHAAQPSSAR